jgi:hypothetical protein
MAYKLLVTIHIFTVGVTTNELSFGTFDERAAAQAAIRKAHDNNWSTVTFAEYEASSPTVYISTGNDTLRVYTGG